MFNSDIKDSALDKLRMANDQYHDWCNRTQEQATNLFNLRHLTSTVLVPEVEDYINSLANTPKELTKTFSEYKAEFECFNSVINQIQSADFENNVKAGGSAAAGVAAGVGTAAFAPSAAMAIATTFGTASTGTAISSLSGAAATKAALAWLGGGALATGGAGVAGGNALLALAGPVGWAIGGVALVGAGFYARSKNAQVAEKANTARKDIEEAIREVQAAHQSTCHIINATDGHIQGIKNLLQKLKNDAPKDYNVFSAEMRASIGALINHVHSLAVLLNKKVTVS